MVGRCVPPPPLLIHFWWIRLVSKKCHVCQILDAEGWICPNQEDKDDFNFPGLYVWIELNEITKNVESVTWQTALYLAIVCAQGFVNVYTVYITPQSLSHKKQIFPYDNVKEVFLSIQLHAVVETQAYVCQSTTAATAEASTHTYSHPHTLITMWMERSVIVGCVKREMEHLRFGRWMDCGGRKYGGGLSGLRKLVLFAFIK